MFNTNPARLPLEANRVLLSVNAKAGRQAVDRKVDRLAQDLGHKGLRVDVLTDLSEVTRLAAQYHAQGELRALVAVGGDGTIAELANRTGSGVPLSLFPTGTSNLLARQLGFVPDPERACQTIAAGNLIQLDAGQAAGRLFLSMVGCGFDADVVRRVHQARHTWPGGHMSYWSYFKPILQSIRSYRYPEIRVRVGSAADGPGAGELPPIVARWVFVCNMPRYGWGLRLAPSADGRDGLLDLCTYRRGSLWQGLRYVAWTQLGRHPRLADCCLRQVRRVRIESGEPVEYQLDGDPGGWLPVDIEVMPGRLTLVVPPEGGLSPRA